MSNPAVTKIARDEIGKLKFWMDDNIGESIHIHIADFRLDLRARELDALSEELADTINKLAAVEGFDCHKIDPVFMSVLLAKKMKHLRAVKIDHVMLGDLLVNHRNKLGLLKFQKLEDGRAVKALKGNSSENDGPRKSHHVGQTSRERLADMKDSISQNGYPYDGQYIILYEDQMLIRDGQHRASCLYVEKGNIEIPVLRLYFDDPKVAAYYTNYLRQIGDGISKVNARWLKKSIKNAVKGVLHAGVSCKNKVYLAAHKKQLKEMERIYFQ